MSENALKSVRPKSSFDSYKPQTEEQKEALAWMSGMADWLISLQDSFAGGSNPLEDGTLFFLSGQPGTGKTHLLEAVINDIRERAPELLDSIYLFRDKFTSKFCSGVYEFSFDRKPIIFLDDLFSEHQSIGDLHDATDIPAISSLISQAYERRWLVVATSNFPLMSGILDRIKKVDKVGRISSRCEEIITGRGQEFEIKGPDYRAIIASQAKKQLFAPRALQNGPG
jgi:DNA replication protein DnaC